MKTTSPFKTHITIRFHEADVAGILFHGNIFELAHNAFEDFLEHIGISWREWFDNKKHAAPIRKAEANYFKPLMAGEAYTIRVNITAIGTTSFTTSYRFFDDEDLMVAEVINVSVFVDPTTITKIEIPARIRSLLNTYRE